MSSRLSTLLSQVRPIHQQARFSSVVARLGSKYETDQVKMQLSSNGTLRMNLNRPAAFNALSAEMVTAINDYLPRINASNDVNCVVVTGEGPKAFCAGGDIKAITEGTFDSVVNFFSTEYEMDYKTATLNKPYVSIWNGFVMGGGMGISVHGKYRVATEKVMVAMPETGIGLFPDVGGSHFLPRLPGLIGLYLGLTGARLNAADCVALGIATHHTSLDQVPALVAALEALPFRPGAQDAQVAEVLSSFHTTPAGDRSISASMVATIDRVLNVPSFPALINRLTNPTAHGVTDAADIEFCAAILKTLRTKCPLSCGVWFDLFHLARKENFDLRQSLKTDLVLGQYFAGTNKANFVEGVRVTLVDKKDTPKYDPATLEETTQQKIDEVFKVAKQGAKYQLDI